jgi:N-acetylglucosamine-6-sulfatase
MVVDDATTADVMGMPNVRHLLVDAGTTFVHNYVPTPLCCPSRATILTGLYPHNHHVLDNVAPYGGFGAFDDSNTIATYLDPAYKTEIVGKYMNDFDGAAPSETYQSPGWDDWRVPVDHTTYNYMHEDLAENGTILHFDRYMPRKYGELADRFIRDTGLDQPWFSYLAWVTPHGGRPHETRYDPPSPYVPKSLRGTYTGRALPKDPSINEADVSDKHAEVASLPLLTDAQMSRIRKISRQRRETLEVVDSWVAKIVADVTAKGELENTYFIFTSDNGWMQGQHRIHGGKDQPYEPAARVPLIIRGPDFPAGLRYTGVTGLQDVTPTILDVTGQPLPAGAPTPDGLSLRQLVTGAVTTTRPQLIEIADGMNAPDGMSSATAAALHPARYQQLVANGGTWKVRGIVTSDRWKYLEFETGEVEMYDLNTDPFELQNLALDPAYAVQRAQLQQELLKYENCAGVSCS